MKRIADSSRGFMMLDALIGLMIVSAVGIILTTAIIKQNIAHQRLSGFRDANRLAERVLLNLQHHQTPPALPNTAFEVHVLPEDAPAGFDWAMVEATVRGRRATLYGIVPQSKGTP
jgi:hypothetical protein